MKHQQSLRRSSDLCGIQHYWDRVWCMGNIARLYEGEEMSAFDSAMLMIDDLARKNVELEQQVWDLQLALWHERKDPREGICTSYRGTKCTFCSTANEAFMYVEEMLHDEA